MNTLKLKQAEAHFLQKYPGGFMHPTMQALGKKHGMEKMIALCQEYFAKTKFSDSQTISEHMVKITSRSSMVSMFEKPKFRDLIQTLNGEELKDITDGLKHFLHGNQQKGFEAMVAKLKPYGLAKWSLLTAIPNYYSPNDEVFVKPTTAKGVIEYFELQSLKYHPTPTWEFYKNYRDAILDMKSRVDVLLAPNNAAFGGFLMMNLNG